MLKNILIIAAWIVGALVLINVLMHLVGMFMMLAMAVGVVALIAVPIYLFWKMRNQDSSASPEKVQLEQKIYDPAGAARLFKKEPSTTLLLAPVGEVDSAIHFDLTNDTIIQIVSDDDKAAVKVRVKSGPYKGKDGWISRGSIVRSPRT